MLPQPLQPLQPMGRPRAISFAEQPASRSCPLASMSALHESVAPPEITIEQSLKAAMLCAGSSSTATRCTRSTNVGVRSRRLKLAASLILDHPRIAPSDYVEEYAQAQQQIQLELQAKNDRIARLRQQDIADHRFARSQEEAERLLIEETRKRIETDKENRAVKAAYEKCMAEYEAYRASVKYEESQRETREQLIKDQENSIEDLKQQNVQLNYRIDELKVATIKYERKMDDLEKSLQQLLRSAVQRNEHLIQSEGTLREENVQLQKRLRELIDANKEVTANYQIVKKNHDLKRHEFEELTLELEEAKSACQLALKNKKQLQNELTATQKTRNELQERIKNLESVLVRKEKDIADLLNKINETINEYELKLERKEEQMWAMSMQLSEETQKNHAAQQAAAAKEKAHTFTVDPDVIGDIEKRWQAKEKSLTDEIDRLVGEIHIRDEKITGKNQTLISEQVADLTKKQFHPRMERLKTIEHDIKNRMEEYALAEERMETGFLCPRDLKFFKVPMTLSPCGHTFCKGCLDAIREENYNTIKCEVCQASATAVYRNEQIETIGEQFARRKHLTLSFLEWIKTLKVYLPSDDGD
ncbi:hypothetical protein HK105_204248 [Polyrhizophydium stewartii]|uniref:RING-type domain-containing protein n=1 Tax=Polyrhizophydium stewartii TaxID=2732419 RepID=A0ABR4N9I8_9FUNG